MNEDDVRRVVRRKPRRWGVRYRCGQIGSTVHYRTYLGAWWSAYLRTRVGKETSPSYAEDEARIFRAEP